MDTFWRCIKETFAEANLIENFIPHSCRSASTTKAFNMSIGIHFSYNKKVENEENFIRHVQKIEKVLKLWGMRNLIVEGEITIFKTLAISETIHLSLATNVPNYQ